MAPPPTACVNTMDDCVAQVEDPGDMESCKDGPTGVGCGLVLEESAV